MLDEDFLFLFLGGSLCVGEEEKLCCITDHQC